MNDPVAWGFARHMAWHFGAAGVLSSAIYFAFRHWKYAAITFAACFYTDLDHLFEYSMVYGLHFDWKAILSGEYFRIVDKRFLWLHSYETLIPIWIWALAKKKYRGAVAFSVGLVSHLVIDQCSYPLKPLAYSLVYRWWHGFSSTAFGM